MTKILEWLIGSCQPKEKSFDPMYFSYETLPMKHTTGGFSVLRLDGRAIRLLLQEARELSADCIFIDSHGVNPAVVDRFDGRGLSKAAVALVLGAHCSVEVVRPKYLIDQYLKPAA
jgi:hypothetical protein